MKSERATDYNAPFNISPAVMDLSHPCDYHGISYAWGPTNDDGSHLVSTVFMSGNPFRVTGNLHQAINCNARELV